LTNRGHHYATVVYQLDPGARRLMRFGPRNQSSSPAMDSSPCSRGHAGASSNDQRI
jgi:hypothetical protein